MKSSSELSRAELLRLRAELKHLESENAEDILLDHAEFCRRFRIGFRTCYNWRKKKLIKSLYIENRIFFRLSEVRKFLEKQETQF